MADHSLNSEQLEIMQYLAQKDGARYPAYELASTLDINITRMKFYLTEFEQVGYVDRRRNASQVNVYGIAHEGRRFLIHQELV